MASDKDKCDLLIVMGSSLKVRPVALIPSSIPNHVPQILINREQLHHLEFDVELLGDGDVIINQICHRLGEDWKEICFDDEILKESKELIPLEDELDDEDTAKEVNTDVDTISMKSTHSTTELATPTTTTTYSDSGFESSSTCSKKEGEFLSPEFMEEPMESTSFGGSCDYRHLSIDSSKDSGILGDASNSASTPTFTNFVDTGEMKKTLNMPASSTQAIATNQVVDNMNNTKTADTNCTEAEKQSLRRQLKHQSAAERLQKGTYYAHDNTASYVFPGAQVSWCSDSEEEDLDDYDDEEDNQCNEDDDTNHAPLSPLMTPSVENEMVKAITSTNAPTSTSSSSSNTNASSNTSPSMENSFCNSNSSNTCLPQMQTPQTQQQQLQKKRHSNDCPGTEEDCEANEAKCLAASNSPPPYKKRRDSAEHMITSTTSSCSVSPNFSLESS